MNHRKQFNQEVATAMRPMTANSVGQFVHYTDDAR